MSQYLFIESRELFERGDTSDFGVLAGALAKADHTVTLFLVGNGVLAARAGAADDRLQALAQLGVKVVADALSLRERGIAVERIAQAVRPVSLDVVVDRLAEGAKALWH
jgi:intracellular sulfur oxidation DsrE/DsrF family protein